MHKMQLSHWKCGHFDESCIQKQDKAFHKLDKSICLTLQNMKDLLETKLKITLVKFKAEDGNLIKMKSPFMN